MSSIGRFLILANLVLAAVFVGFAGTYLNQATNYKAERDQLEAGKQAAEERASNEIAQLQRLVSEKDTNLSGTSSLLRSTENRLSEALAENSRLSEQLANLQGSMKAAESSLATIGDQVTTAFSRAEDAYKKWVEADRARVEAENRKVAAEGDLRDAQTKIADLESSLAERSTKVASLTSSVGELETVLNSIRVRYPDVVLGAAVPDMSGVVKNVSPDGRLATIELSHKSGDAKKGHRLAIHANGSYKGEFLVDTVDGDYLFGRLQPKNGTTVTPGDKADSNPGR